MSKIWYYYKGKAIPFSYRQKVITAVGDKDEAGRVFYRAFHWGGVEDPVRWIAEGLKTGYAYHNHPDEFTAQDKVLSWMKRHWLPWPTPKGVQQIGEIMRKAGLSD